MTIPTSRENSTRALSTADLAAASRQSPRVNPDPDEIPEAEPEQSTRDREAGELEREEVMASRKGGANTDAHRRRADAAANSPGAEELSRDDDLGSAGEVRQSDEIERHRDDEMRSGRLRPGKPSHPEVSPGAPADDPHDELLAPLFAAEQAEGYRNRWIAIQSSFVDDPSGAVRAGDELVAQVMSELANSFAQQRHRIESELGDPNVGNTEDLRVALKSYRSFFERLLSL
jgi:hypothetical protein